MTTETVQKAPRTSEFLSQATADSIAGALDLLYGPEAEAAYALQSLRARTYAWGEKLARNEHQQHAIQIIGGHLAAGVAAEFTKANEGDRFSRSQSVKDLMSDPKAREESKGEGVAQGVPLPPVLIGNAGNEGALALLTKVTDHVGAISDSESGRPDMMGDLFAMTSMGRVVVHEDLMRDLMEVAKDMPPREHRTPYQQKLVAAVTFLSTEIAVDGLEWAGIGLRSRSDQKSADLEASVGNALHKISNESKRLWRNDGVPGFEGQDLRATAASKPAPHEFGAFVSSSERTDRPKSIAKGPSQGMDVADAMVSAKGDRGR